MRSTLTITAFVFALLVGATAASAQSQNLAVLMPGAGGASAIDFLVRNEQRIRAAGIETIVTTSPSKAASLVRAAVEKNRKVFLVGMSRGGRDIAKAIKLGARPTGAVFVSGAHNVAIEVLGSPALLPPTLVVHHRHDACPKTSPADAQRFVKWTGGKAKLRWIDNTGEPHRNPCGPRGAHGYYLKDGSAVSAIVAFIRGG